MFPAATSSRKESKLDLKDNGRKDGFGSSQVFVLVVLVDSVVVVFVVMRIGRRPPIRFVVVVVLVFTTVVLTSIW